MSNKLFALSLVVLLALVAGCTSSNAVSQNANVAGDNSTKPGPDNSEIVTKVDANGVKTEERVFHNNPRIQRVVVTTKDGKRTATAYSPKGEEKELNESDSQNVLEATGDKVADAAGFVADKSVDVAKGAKDVGDATKDKAEDIGEKTVDTAKKVGSKTVDTTKTVGSKTVEGAKTVTEKGAEGAKTVGNKTVEETKKAGRAVKKIVP